MIKKYKGKKHPAISDGNIICIIIGLAYYTLAPEFFKAFPNMQSLAKAKPEMLFPLISKVRGYIKKSNWLITIATQLKNDKNIPLAMDALGRNRNGYSFLGRETCRSSHPQHEDCMMRNVCEYYKPNKSGNL